MSLDWSSEQLFAYFAQKSNEGVVEFNVGSMHSEDGDDACFIIEVIHRGVTIMAVRLPMDDSDEVPLLLGAIEVAKRSLMDMLAATVVQDPVLAEKTARRTTELLQVRLRTELAEQSGRELSAEQAETAARYVVNNASRRDRTKTEPSEQIADLVAEALELIDLADGMGKER